MLIELTNRILIILLIMSGLTVFRHGYYFIQAFFTSTEEEPVKYRVSRTALLFLCISIAYILSIIFTGITLE